jgi:hypothetical protein
MLKPGSADLACPFEKSAFALTCNRRREPSENNSGLCVLRVSGLCVVRVGPHSLYFRSPSSIIVLLNEIGSRKQVNHHLHL